MNKEQKAILNKAIVHYGAMLQCVVAIEEMAELQKEISKGLRNRPDTIHMAEEIADVLIMIEQLKLIWAITDTEVKEWIDKKLLRTEVRINEMLQANNANTAKKV